MTGDNRTKATLIAVIAVSIVIIITGINAAHAYNSSLAASGKVSVEFLSIDIIDDSEKQPTWSTDSPELAFSLPTSESDRAYCIRVSCNGPLSAYVYGYFSCDTKKPEGVAVKNVQLDFEDGTSAILHKNAYDGTFDREGDNNEVATELEEMDGYYCHDYKIIRMTVNYYPGTGTEKAVLWNGAEVASGVALDPSDFEFHFLASREPLLVES